MRDLDNTQDILDVRDIIARVEELRDALETYEYDGREDDVLESATLEKFLEELKGNGGDEQWNGDWYPVSLIRDSYFVEAMQELCEDCGLISKDLPHWVEIDWHKTARNMRVDYQAAEFDGVTYWFR